MLKPALFAAVLFATASVAAPAKSPAEIWAASLKEDNAAWATEKHAILKINDAAYVHQGEFVSLMGDRKKPSSWHWKPGKLPGAVMIASFAKGQPAVSQSGKPIAPEILAKGVAIAPGVDVIGYPAQMSPGEMGLRIMVFDQDNKAAKSFKGVDYFAYDPAFRVTASFKPDPKLTPRIFRTSRGLDKQFYHTGDATFTLKGKTITLPLYSSDNQPGKIADMSSFFIDDLTGKGAYSAGRYVEAEKFGKFPPKSVTIDFNFAYNPNCARSSFFNCPFAVDRIPLAVMAGEKDPHATH